MSSWSSNYSRSIPRTNLKPASSFDYQHGHSSNNSLDGSKHFRPPGSGKTWYHSESKTESTNINLEGSTTNYQQKDTADSGQSFRSWNSKPEWKSDLNELDGSGSMLPRSNNRNSIMQNSFEWLSELSPTKKSIDLLIKTPQTMSSVGPSSHDSGFSDKPFSSNISDNDAVGGDMRNISYSITDLSAYQRKKTSKAFDYLKTWRLKMNMPTDSFMVEKEVSGHNKRHGGCSSIMDTSAFQSTSYADASIAAGSERLNSMDERGYLNHSSSSQFEQGMFNASSGQIPTLEQNIKGGTRMNEPPWKINNSVHSNQNLSGYNKRNYNSSVMDDKDSASLSGMLVAKRPRLLDGDDSRPSHPKSDSPFQKQPYASHNDSNFYKTSDFKNPGAVSKRESSNWHSRLVGQNYDQAPNKWSSQLNQDEPLSPRRLSGRESPQQSRWSNSPGLLQRNNQGHQPRRFSPSKRSPEHSPWTRSPGEQSRGRSGAMISKSRSPITQRGQSARDTQKFSPRPLSSRMQSPGLRFSPKGRSSGLLQREKSPGASNKQRSRGTSSKGRSPVSLGRERSPRQHRRSITPVASGISSRISRGRSPASHKSAEIKKKSSHPSTGNSGRYQHIRGRSLERNSHNRSQKHGGSRSPVSLTCRQSQNSSERLVERRADHHFKRISPNRSRGKSPGYITQDRSPARIDRERTPKSFGRERSPREFSKPRSSGHINRDEQSKHGSRERSHGKGNSSCTRRYKSPENIDKGRTSSDVRRDRPNPIKNVEGKFHRPSARVSRERSPQFIGKSQDLRQSSRQKDKRWFEGIDKETSNRTFDQRKRSPEPLTRGRSRLDNNVKSGESHNSGKYKRSPMFDELSPSPRSNSFWSPIHESSQGKKPEFSKRNSWSPVDLPRGCSPVSPQPAFERPDSRTRHLENSPVSSSIIRMKGVNMQPFELQRGCSPVSPEGYSRSWSNNITKHCSISPDSCDRSGYKRKKSSEDYRKITSLESCPDGIDDLEGNERKDAVSPLEKEIIGGGNIVGDDDNDEDLRVHLLRLREQKVEMKLRMLEEESIETELKLRQLQKKSILEDEEDLTRNNMRCWSDNSPVRSRSRGRLSRSTSPSKHYSSHTEDHQEKYRDRGTSMKYVPNADRNRRNLHQRYARHFDGQFQRNERF